MTIVESLLIILSATTDAHLSATEDAGHAHHRSEQNNEHRTFIGGEYRLVDDAASTQKKQNDVAHGANGANSTLPDLKNSHRCPPRPSGIVAAFAVATIQRSHASGEPVDVAILTVVVILNRLLKTRVCVLGGGERLAFALHLDYRTTHAILLNTNLKVNAGGRVLDLFLLLAVQPERHNDTNG